MKVDKSKWKQLPLGEICEILNGYAFKSSLYIPENGLRVIRIANVQDGYISDELPQYYPLSYEQELNKYILYEGDLLMSLTGNVGRVGILPKEMLPAMLNQRVACLRLKQNYVKKFLYYRFRYREFISDCSQASKGIAQLNLSTEWLKKYIISIPSINVQNTIASELDALQEVIDGYREQMADLDALAQSIFIDTFGHVSINDKEWPIIHLGKLGSFKNGLNFDKQERGVKIKVIGVGDFKDLKRLDDFENISLIELTNISEEYLLRNEDIIFVRSNGNKNLVGRCLEVFPGSEAISYSGFCIRFRKNSDINNSYLLGILTDKEYKTAHILKSNGIGIQNINQKILTNLPIPVPPIELQQHFATQVEAIEQQKDLIRQQLADAEMLLSERMQYYFS